MLPAPEGALAAAAAALACALFPRLRVPAVALTLGLLRGAIAERPAPHAPITGDVEALVESVEGRRAVLRIDHARALATVEPPVHRGSRVLLDARLWPPAPRLNPGGQDERHDLALRGIALAGRAELIAQLAPGPPGWVLIDGIRARFTARAAQRCSDPDRAAVVAALAVGDRSLLAPATEDELAASGLVHLLASSGLHLAVVTFVAREGLRRLWLRTPWPVRIRASLIASLAALPLVVAEVLLLGAPWPAVRAGIAATIALLAAALLRRASGLQLLAVATAACAAVDPASTHDLALQLSALGILGLLVLAPRLRALLPLPRTALEPLVRLACATAAATLCTAPLLAATFHRVSLASVAANTLALWPGLAAIPLATALVALDWTPLWLAADTLAGLTLSAARLFAHVPFAVVRVPAPGLLACAAWVVALALLARFRLRLALGFATVACLAMVRPAPHALRITFLAVGQGDAAIVQFAGGGAMLIDGGGDLHWPPRTDPGARVVLPALAELGIRRLDVVVLTHPHPDHAGGLLTVLDQVPVGELWMNPGDDPITRAVAERAQSRGVAVRAPASRAFGAARVEVLSRHDAARSANDDSIVLRISEGSARALLPGDVEAYAESELAQADISAQLLKAPHHGSRTSSTDAFLRKVAPDAVVYSVGAHNGFGFPHDEVVARAHAFGARTFRTDFGSVSAIHSGGGWLVVQ